MPRRSSEIGLKAARAVSPGLHAVLTGDVVGSTALDESARAGMGDALRSAYRAIRDRVGGSVLYPIEVSGGDTWQCYIDDPAIGLGFATCFRALLLAESGIETRLVVAIDTIDFLDTGNLGESDGAAFRRSGRTLRSIGGDTTRIVLPESTDPLPQLAANIAARCTDYLGRSWTRAQAQSVAHIVGCMLAGESCSQEEIGKRWQPNPISQQAVARHLQSAGWDTLEPTLIDFAEIVRQLPPSAP